LWARCDVGAAGRDRWGNTALRDALQGGHAACAALLCALGDLRDAPEPEPGQACRQGTCSRCL